MKALVWMHRDLRQADHPALDGALAAVERGDATHVDVIYAWSQAVYGNWMPGQAQQWWIHEHLKDLLRRLARCGVRLVVTRQSPSAYLAAETGVHSVHFNDPLLPAARREAKRLCKEADRRGMAAFEYPGDLLHDPDEIRTGNGDPYRVFTPFSRRFHERVAPERCEPLAAAWIDGASRGRTGTGGPISSDDVCEAFARLDRLGLHPRHAWVAPLASAWAVGEAAAHDRLAAFTSGPITQYAEGRDRPDEDGTSRLSPYLAIGVLSPRQVFAAVRSVRAAAAAGGATDTETYLRELIWREFGYHLLLHFPETASTPLRPEWSRFPWREDAAALAAWKQGRTGFPIVDAGMRQLWQSGWMHNRVRMITASFLTKDLMISWQEGAAWFWDTLIDADLASNTLGWQWAAGSGADAQPYFRIFNPESQLKKHDPRGAYVRAWIPELDDLSYAAPIVDHAAARKRALAAYETFRKATKKDG